LSDDGVLDLCHRLRRSGTSSREDLLVSRRSVSTAVLLTARYLPYISRYGSTAVLLTALAACGSTSHFVDQPPLTIDGSEQDTRRAVAQLFGTATPYTIRLCEADPSSKECKAEDEGISATGVGGLFLPLFLHVHGMRVSQERPSADGLAIEVSFESNADGIPPLCATADGRVISRGNNTALLEASNFYCNWMAVGNVLANADLSIDRIDLKDRTFTGYYKLTFYGTGNVSGSGYYKAVLTPKTAQSGLFRG
jgi:hypothetical protein